MTRWALALLLLTLTGCAAFPVPATAGGAAPVPAGGAAPVPAGGAAPRPPESLPPATAAISRPVPSPPLALVSPAPAPGVELAASADELAALDDDEEEQGPTAGQAPVARAAPAGPPLSDAEIAQRFHHDPASLGPASIGPASAGALVNGVQMPRGDHWQLLDPGRAWGTQETVDALVRSIERVNERLPGAPPVAIGHLSAKNGGHLSPHKSHQSGRDADVGYYYKSGPRPFVHATEDNLDLAAHLGPRQGGPQRDHRRHDLHRSRRAEGPRGLRAAVAARTPAFVDEVFQSPRQERARPHPARQGPRQPHPFPLAQPRRRGDGPPRRPLRGHPQGPPGRASRRGPRPPATRRSAPAAATRWSSWPGATGPRWKKSSAPTASLATRSARG